MTTPVDLAALLAPLSITDFTRTILGVRNFRAVDGDRARVQAGLLGWADFNDLLATAVLGPDPFANGRVEVIVGERRLGAADLCRPAQSPGMRRLVDPARLTHAVRAGARLVIHEVDTMHKAVALLCNDVGRHFRASMTARLVAVWQTPWHARFEKARTDFLVVQLAGCQRWETRPDQTAWADREEASTLEPGAVAYVPRDWLYKSSAVAFPTLQLFLDASLPTEGEFISWVAARLLAEDDTLRESLPEDAVALVDEETELLRRLAAACEDDTSLNCFRTEHDCAVIESMAWFGFPWTATKEVLPPDNVALRFNGPRFPERRGMPNGVEFRMRGAQFKCDKHIAEALEPLFAGESRTVGQLLAGHTTDALREVLVDLLLAGHIVPEDSKY